MNNNKYEDRVRRRATEFAICKWGEEDWTYLNDHAKKGDIEEHMDMARLSVQREAEAHEQGFRTGLRSGHNGIKIKRSDDLFNKGFISEEERIRCENEPKIEQSNGLIPPQTETV